jgi:anti-sigma factor RsiW
MTLEQLEFSITQYLDGTLPAEDVGALEARLASDPQARAMLDEQRALTDLLRSQPGPDLDWAEVARDLSAVVTGTVSEQSRVEDQKLNAVLKAATALPEIRWEALSQQISAAVDAAVTDTDADDERFDEMLRSASQPLLALNWDRLASHLSGAVAAAEAEREEEREERPAVLGRIGWVRTFGSLAVAACVLVATGLGLRSYMTTGGNTNAGGSHVVAPTPVPPQVAQATTPKVEIDVPTAEDTKQPAVAEITIGPSKSYAASDEGYHYTASRSPVVIVTPADRGSDDAESSWLGVE